MNNKSFPDLEETKKRIPQLFKIKIPELVTDSNPIEICKKWLGDYYKIFPELPVRKKIFESKEFDAPLYRASILREGFNENLLFEYSYPPRDKAPLGRCNFPVYPVLYTSFDPIIALKETITEDELPVTLYISRWKVIPDDNIQIVLQEFMPENLPQNNPYFNKNNLIRSIDEFPPFLKTDSQKQAFLEITKAFYNSFISSTDYIFSRILSHQSFFIYDGGATDIILYPSVKDLSKINAAISPNFADNQMQIDRIYVLSVYLESIQITHFSEVINNKTNFVSRKNAPEKFTQILSEDFPDCSIT